MPDYNLPGTYADIQDGGLRISKPVLQPKVTIIGYTDKATVSIMNPYSITRRENIYLFDLDSGVPSEMSLAASEIFDGGADNVEMLILSHSNPTGISADQRYTDLDTAYELLLNTNVDIIVPVTATIDTQVSDGAHGETRNFGYQLANFCYRSTVNNNTAIGVIGVTPPIANVTGTPTLSEMNIWLANVTGFDTTSTSAFGGDFSEYDGITDVNGDGVPDNYAFYATSTERIPAGNPPANDNTVLTDAMGNPVDIGQYISVVAAHLRSSNGIAIRVNPTLGWYTHNGAGTYAGLISALPARRAPSNKILPNSTVSRNMSLRQASNLATARFVTVLGKPDGNKLTHAVTGAYNISTYYRSDFVNLSTVRIVHESINMVRAVAEPFLGEPNNPINRNALENEIDEALGRMVKDGSLLNFSFNILSTPSMQILGNILIDVKLEVAFEIKTITMRVALVPPGTLGS